MTYFLYKVGVYGQGVYWIGDDPDVGKRQADMAASKDDDDYHDWCLYRFVYSEDFDNFTEHELVYETKQQAKDMKTHLLESHARHCDGFLYEGVERRQSPCHKCQELERRRRVRDEDDKSND